MEGFLRAVGHGQMLGSHPLFLESLGAKLAGKTKSDFFRAAVGIIVGAIGSFDAIHAVNRIRHLDAAVSIEAIGAGLKVGQIFRKFRWMFGRVVVMSRSL